MKKVRIDFPNGDIFEGYMNSYGFKVGEGKYIWSDGYFFKGNWFGNYPLGLGTYRDALGVVRKGFWYKGFLLQNSHGLEHFLADRMSLGFEKCCDRLALEILDKPHLGEKLINNNKDIDYKIDYNLLFQDIELTKKNMVRDMSNLQDGELDSNKHWGHYSNRIMKKSIYINENIKDS